jgi:hypothetical protein
MKNEMKNQKENEQSGASDKSDTVAPPRKPIMCITPFLMIGSFRLQSSNGEKNQIKKNTKEKAERH